MFGMIVKRIGLGTALTCLGAYGGSKASEIEMPWAASPHEVAMEAVAEERAMWDAERELFEAKTAALVSELAYRDARADPDVVRLEAQRIVDEAAATVEPAVWTAFYELHGGDVVKMAAALSEEN